MWHHVDSCRIYTHVILCAHSDEGVNPPDEQLFVKQTVEVAADGTFSVSMKPNEIVTVTTLSTGFKGVSSSPPRQNFALPYVQDFDKEVIAAPPALFYDQMGAWEIAHATGL